MTADDQAAAAAAAQRVDRTARAVAVLAEAVRTERDFAEWLIAVVGRVAGEVGGGWVLTQGRPGSWEASLVDQLVKGATGYDDEHLQLAEWRTRAPQFGYTAYGLDVGENNYMFFAAGHVDPRRFIAAANHFIRHNEEGARLADYLGDRPPKVVHVYAGHDWNSTEQEWRLTELYAVEGRLGTFPVTVLEY